MNIQISVPATKETPLTARESEILDLIAQGYTSKEIARKLDISPYTVNTHRDNLRRKLGVHNGAQLAYCQATRNGRINPIHDNAASLNQLESR
jgi:DNA-binding CsgD family transcriptional regulator